MQGSDGDTDIENRLMDTVGDGEGGGSRDYERSQAPECQNIHLIEQIAENEINPSLLSSRGTCGQTKEQHGLNLEVTALYTDK